MSMAKWDEADHPRDSEGRFSRLPGVGVSVSDGKRKGIRHTTITASRGGTKLGHIRLTDGGSEIDELSVSLAARGKGVARGLLDEAVDRFGDQTMRLHASPFGKGGLDAGPLMALYAKHGFVPDPSRGPGYVVRRPGQQWSEKAADQIAGGA